MATGEDNGGHRPGDEEKPVGGRQLTIGEALAIARYTPAWTDEYGRIELTELLLFIDRLRVCTTCGWPKHLHTGDANMDRLIGSCPQHCA